MDIIQTSNKFLNALFLKSQDDLRTGSSEKIIAKLIELDNKDTQNIITYITGKGWLDTSNGIGDNIILSTTGIDHVTKLRENKIYKKLKFKPAIYLATTRDAIEFLYPYEIIDENGKSESKTIKVSISGTLGMMWGYQIWGNADNIEYAKLSKILLQFGKDKIVEKLKEGTLNDNEEFMLLTTTHPKTSPFNPDNLIEPQYAEYEIEVGQKLLSEEIKENKLAASIIETRDSINAVFKIKNKVKLLLLDEERNLLDFFKTASSVEEFSHRISSLGHISRHINTDILREILNEPNKELKSVQLLEKYIAFVGKTNKNITDTLRQFGRIRQGYPNHADIKDAIEGFAFFNIKYPVEDFENAWAVLLNKYLTSLKELYEIIADTSLKKEK